MARLFDREKKANENAVVSAQIDHLYRQLPSLLSYSLLVGLVLSGLLHKDLPIVSLVNWLGILLLTIMARLFLYIRYFRNRGEKSPRFWANWYVFLAGISGLVWGLAGVVLFTPDNLLLQGLLLLVLSGLGAASATVLTMYLPAFYAYLPVSIIPIGAMMFSQADDPGFFMGLFAFIFLFSVLTFGRASGRGFQRSMEARFENVDLVARLEKQKEKLEVANLAKSKFLAAASHDLRQPLHSLSLFSELLQKQADDRRTRDLAVHISSSVGVLDRLFSALLDISRIDAGVMRPYVQVFQLKTIIDRVFNDSLPKARNKNLDLFVDGCDEFTETDPTLLERIVRNLISNAIRYTQSGNVTIRFKRAGPVIQLSVIDTGVGIARHQVEYIFEEFTQLDNPERDSSKGLGLGLSIVQRLVQLLNLRMEIDSRPGHGSRFTLILPYHERPQWRLVSPDPDTSHPWAALDLSVLVVDDDLEILEGTRQLLESWGCTVATAATAQAALETARQMEKLDALVTDFRLPEDARGTQVVKSIRELLGNDLPALLITGDMEPARLQEAEALKLQLLHKPVRPARLRAWLQKLGNA